MPVLIKEHLCDYKQGRRRDIYLKIIIIIITQPNNQLHNSTCELSLVTENNKRWKWKITAMFSMQISSAYFDLHQIKQQSPGGAFSVTYDADDCKEPGDGRKA